MDAEIIENLQPVTDSLEAQLQRYLEGNLVDSLQPVVDSAAYILALSVVAQIGDTVQPVMDQPSYLLEDAYAGVLEDVVPAVQDRPSYGLINLKRPQKWVAPVTITPQTFELPTLRLASHAVRHPLWYFEPRVKSYGQFTRAISAPVGFVRTGDTSIQVIDTDNSVRRSISAKTIKRAAVDVRLGPENGRYSAFLRPLNRRVSNVSQGANGILEFLLKDYISDLLDRSFIKIINSENFPNLPSGVQESSANSIVGVVSSINGAIPCPLVDTVNNWYLVQSNKSKSVDAVYRRVAVSDEQGIEWELVSSSEYTMRQDYFLVNPEVGGSYATILQFSSPQTSEIRANVSGLVDDSGQMILTNFADYLQAAFGYLAYFANSSDVLNLDSFAETREKVADLACAGAITENMTWAELISRVQRSSNIDVYADKNDRIAIKYTGDNDEPVISLDDVLRLYSGSVRQEMASPVFNRFPYRYAPNYAAGIWTEGEYNNEEDLDYVGGEIMADQELQMYFVRDAATADAVIRRRAQYCTLDSAKFSARIPMVPVLENLELGDLVTITHHGGFDATGYVNKQFKVTKLIMDIDRLSYQIDGIVRRVLPPNSVVTNPDGSGDGGNDNDGRTGIKYGSIPAMPARNCRPGPFTRGHDGELFGIFKLGGDQRRLVAFYTLNYGVTWNVADYDNSPMTDAWPIDTYDCCLNQVLDDDKIHVAFAENVYDCRHYYATFNMATRKWSAKEFVVQPTGVSTSTCVSIECRNPGGEPVIFYQGERRPGTLSPSLRNRGYYLMKSGSSWSGGLVTPDGLTYEFWSFGTMIVDCDCYVQRVVRGRNNRMHFFFATMQGSQYFMLSMNGSGQLQQPPRRYKYGYSLTPWQHGLPAPGYYNDDANFIFYRRQGTAHYADFWTEAGVCELIGSTKVSGDTVDNSTYDHEPHGFGGADILLGGAVHLAAVHKTFGTHALYHAGAGADGIQCGPEIVYPHVIYKFFGNFIGAFGRTYCAQFTGPEGDFPIFRWLGVNQLPYTGA